jgi:hypothetical protein
MTNNPWEQNNTMVENQEFPGTVLDIPTEEEVRCPYCGRLVCKGRLGVGTAIEIKCPRRKCEKMFNIRKL